MRITSALLCALAFCATTCKLHAQCAVRAAQNRRAQMMSQLQQQQQRLLAQRQQQQANLRQQQQQQAVLQARRQQQLMAQQQQRQAFLQLQRQREGQMIAVRNRVLQMKRAELFDAMLRNRALLRQATALNHTLLQQALVRDFVELKKRMSDEADKRWGEQWKGEMQAKIDKEPKQPEPAITSLSAKQEPKARTVTASTASSAEVLSLGTSLIGADRFRQEHVLKQLRKGKGSAYTKALALAIPLLEESSKDKARRTLAERLVRMKTTTLRRYLTHEQAEIRRATVMAIAMKHLQNLIPEMVERLNDDESSVVLATRAALKAMTKQDFGPPAEADSKEQAQSVQKWKSWLKQHVAVQK